MFELSGPEDRWIKLARYQVTQMSLNSDLHCAGLKIQADISGLQFQVDRNKRMWSELTNTWQMFEVVSE